MMGRGEIVHDMINNDERREIDLNLFIHYINQDHLHNANYSLSTILRIKTLLHMKCKTSITCSHKLIDY